VNAILDLFRRIVGLPHGESTVADQIDWLHCFIITSTFVVATYVFVMVVQLSVRWRRKKAGELTQRYVSSRRLEILLVGTVTCTFLMWWVIGFRQYGHMTQPPPDSTTVYVEAKQWMWKFVDEDGRAENDTLTVEAGRPVRLVMSSRDVIHSFYAPDFRLKQDVVPGRTTTLWFEAKTPGVFPIWCAEYCGLSHSAMRGEIVVLSREDYARWRASSPRGGGLVAQGRDVAVKRGCVACHTLDGSRHIGPSFGGLYGREVVLTDGRRIVADEAYLTKSMMEPNADVVDGYKPVMPTYRGTLTPAETGALVELIKSLPHGGGS